MKIILQYRVNGIFIGYIYDRVMLSTQFNARRNGKLGLQ